MIMENVILILVIAAILGFAIGYVIRTKKKGHKCIGCPSDGCEQCNGGCRFDGGK